MVKWKQIETKPFTKRWIARFQLVSVSPLMGYDFHTFVTESREWCTEQFGPDHHGHPEKYRWHMDRFTAHFRYAEDAFAFKMRWC